MLHLMISFSCLFHSPVCLTKLCATRGLTVIHTVTAVKLCHIILLFAILAFDSIINSKYKCKRDNEA
jgi:hypothetical protein